MAEICGGSSGKGGYSDDGGDRPRVGEAEAERPLIDYRHIAGASSSIGVVVRGGNRGSNSHATVVGSGGDRRTPMEEGCTPVVTAPGDPQVRRLDPQSDIEALVVTRGDLAGAGRAAVERVLVVINRGCP